MKVIINTVHGGLSFSAALYRELNLPAPEEGYGWLYDWRRANNWTENQFRRNETLIAAIERTGCEEASGRHAAIKIVDIPFEPKIDDDKWEIEEYDGLEHVREVSRSWG